MSITSEIKLDFFDEKRLSVGHQFHLVEQEWSHGVAIVVFKFLSVRHSFVGNSQDLLDTRFLVVSKGRTRCAGDQ